LLRPAARRGLRLFREETLAMVITRKIIEAHGGTLEMESEVGTGTTVIVRLPDYSLSRDGA